MKYLSCFRFSGKRQEIREKLKGNNGQNRFGTFSHFSMPFHTFQKLFRSFPPGRFLESKGGFVLRD